MATNTPSSADGATPPEAKIAQIETAKAGFAGAGISGGTEVSPTGTAQRPSNNRTAGGQFAGPSFMRRHPSTRHY